MSSVPPLSDDLPDWPVDLCVSTESAGERLDSFVTAKLSNFSRAAVQRAIAEGQVLIEGEVAKASQRLKAGWQVEVAGIDTIRPGPEPEEIPLDILHEDDWLIVVNKPAGMIVHPAKGHWQGTLASALAFSFEQLSKAGGPTRPGIVHRLDRDTSGVIVVAKHDRAHHALAAQFHDRTVDKEYLAIVRGVPDRDADVVDRPIGQHPKIREQMAIRPDDPAAKPAVTKLEVVERFERFALIKAMPKTGRTHQIRVHLASIGLPVLCDKLYGGSSQSTAADLGISNDQQVILARQALHARQLSLGHPQTGARITFEAPLPEDISAVISCLRS
jgi:23S rRNA pseudouridine1911/1915/1917 synthase